MYIRSIKYPIFAIYEVFRSVLILQAGVLTNTAALPITWYAGLPLFCLVPFLFIMLAADEKHFASWLRLVSLVKAMGVITLVVYIVKTLPDAIRFGAAGEVSLFGVLVMTAFFVVVDAALVIYCFGRNRILCKSYP